MFRSTVFALIALPALVSAQGAAAAKPAAPPPPAEVRVISPANNASVTSPFRVVFGLRNYGVAPAGVNAPRTGHFHVLVNNEAPAAGTVIPNDSTHIHFGMGQIEAMVNLAPGTYTLRLVLADFEHKAMGPEFSSAPLHVTVTAPAAGRK